MGPKDAVKLLAADVGGTSARMALFEWRSGKLAPTRQRTYASRLHEDLTGIVEEFLGPSHERVDQACFAIAGPVQGDSVATPNLPWSVSADVLRERCALESVVLINDLEANAWGISLLHPDHLLALNAIAKVSQGNAALISAGTGLGEAGLYFDGTDHRPFASEGGHEDFAPRTLLEADLWKFLYDKFGHVSYERVLSGPGLKNLYDFFGSSIDSPTADVIERAMQQGDPAPVIAAAALDSTCPRCVAALDLFASIYGAEAGNLALKFKSVSGLYIGGGIAPKIAEKLRDGDFLRAFVDKGRLRPFLELIPVRLILNPHTALLGAARYAGRRLGVLP
jgi:glucokinase